MTPRDPSRDSVPDSTEGTMPGDPDVSALADAVVDGAEVDWAAAESAAAPDALPVVRALREVETVLGAHREVLSEESPPRRSRPKPLQAGDTWSYLQIRRFLGGGGFGDVYEAFDPRIQRATALKVLDAPDVSDEALLQEARLLAKVSHPNVVKVYGADRVDGRVGISMELLEGHTLSDELDQFGTMSADDAVVIGMKLCDALAEVHRKGIVHRDVKAQNVMRASGGRIVLMDFGIGLDESTGDSARPAGTPAYQAPELLAGGAPGVATDVYALGVLLFHLVTADFPVRGGSLREFRDCHESGDVKHLPDLRSGLPEAFVEVVEKALEPDPERRFQSAGAFHRALSRAMESTILGAEGRRVGWNRSRAVYWRGAVWTALLLALLAAGWWLLAPPDQEPPEENLVFLGHVEDRALDAAFGGTTDAALRSALRESPVFEPVSWQEVREVSRRMRRVDLGAHFVGPELVEGAIRTGARGFVEGEIRAVSDGWELSVWLSPTAEPGARQSVHRSLRGLTTASLEDALRDLVRELESLSSEWRSAGGILRVASSRPKLERATTNSLPALTRYSEGLRAYEEGEIEDSERKLRAAVSADPEFAMAHLHLGHTLSARGDQEEALHHFQKAFDLREQFASELERWTIEAAYRAVFRQYLEAIEAYGQVLDRVEADPSVRRQLALAHLELRQHDKAIANARLGLEDSLNHGLLVYVLAVAGRPQQALDEAASIREELGASPYLIWSEGLALLGLERTEEAFARLREVHETSDGIYGNLASWLEARIHLYSGDLETASGVLYRDRSTDAVESSDFLEIRRRYWAARIQAIRGQRSRAEGGLRALGRTMIPAQLTSWRSVGVLQAELGDIEEAQRTLAGLESIHATHPSLISDMVTTQLRAEIYLARNEPQQAVETLRTAGGLSDVGFVRTSARAHAAVGDLEEAVFLGERFFERKGEVLDKAFVGFWVEAHVRQARLLEQMGRSGDAAEHWREARRLWGGLADEAFGPGAPADALPWIAQ